MRNGGKQYKMNAINMRSWRWVGIVAIVLLITISSVILSRCGSHHFRSVLNSEVSTEDSPRQLDDGIRLAAKYLVAANLPDGSFLYEVNASTGEVSDKYSVVRHAGAMYALGSYYDEHPQDDVKRAILRASEYLKHDFQGEGPTKNTLAIWSKNDERNRADLGATGLGIVGLSAAYRLEPTNSNLSELQALGRFILAMQKPDGSFYNSYRAGEGYTTDHPVLYYPGEATLGLLSLYQIDHSKTWLFAAGRGLTFLAQSRIGLSEVPPDHWALIATEKLLNICKITLCPFDENLLRAHALQIATSIVRSQDASPRSFLAGAFDAKGRTTPTATRMEGLLAARNIVDKSAQPMIDSSIHKGIRFLLNSEIYTGPFAGAMPGEKIGSLQKRSKVRIDFVQHALSAMLRYRRDMSGPQTTQ